MAGYLAGTTNISSCIVTGSVSGNYRVGGVIGYDYISGIGTIEYSSFNGTVEATGANSGVGGFIGEKSGNSIIQKCSVEGTLTAAGRNCGGFVGWIDEGEINQCYTTVNVTCNTSSYGRIGGFAGALSYYSTRAGEINNCYARGSVSVPNSTNTSSYGIGGFVGAYYADGDNKVYNSFATGLVNAPNASNYVGGFSGEDHGGSSCGSGNFWDEETTEQDWSGCEGLGETGKTTAQMKTLDTYTNAGWDFSSIWAIDGTTNDGYPYLQWQNSVDFPAGEGTDLGDGITLNPTLDLNYAADQTIPEIPNGSFTPDNEFVLTGSGIVDITITTSSQYGSYYQSGSWNTEQNSGGTILFEGINFDAKGDVPIVLGDEDPLPVTLSSFTAIQTEAGFTRLNWTTQSETNNAYWNVYRAATDEFSDASSVNNEPIDGQGTSAEETSYTFVDESDLQSQTYWYWLESVSLSGAASLYEPISITMEEIPDNPTPPANIVYGVTNYPNPFNPETDIKFAFKETVSNAELSIYNLKGQKIRTLYQGSIESDRYYTVTWDGKDKVGKKVASGIYFYKLETEHTSYLKKMTLIK